MSHQSKVEDVMSTEDSGGGSIYAINYDRRGVFGPTDDKVGKFEIQADGTIKAELFTVPGSGQMILRRNNLKSFDSR
jgi:hypothetical protein